MIIILLSVIAGSFFDRAVRPRRAPRLPAPVRPRRPRAPALARLRLRLGLWGELVRGLCRWRGLEVRVRGQAGIGGGSAVGIVGLSRGARRDGGCDLLGRTAVLEDGDEVAEDLLTDEKAALDLANLGGLDIEVDEEVARLAVATDVVRQAALAPWRDLAEAATAVDDGAGDLLDRGLELVVLQVRPKQKHEFVAAHQVLLRSSLWVCDVRRVRARTRQKGVRAVDMNHASVTGGEEPV